MPWGLFPADSEIPLVTVTENAGLFLEGALVSGVYKHPRKPGGQRPGPSQLAEVGACGSTQLSCLVLGALASPFPLASCLLGAGEGEAIGQWDPQGTDRRASALLAVRLDLLGVRPQSVYGNPSTVACLS